jgi:3',5'-cyclic AMP phosphodiesterase CpdA
MTRRLVIFALTALPLLCQQLGVPNKSGSLKFAVMGDNGTGGKEEYEVAQRMVEYYKVFPFEFVTMLGDNLYGGESPKDFLNKFEAPYRTLLNTGVKFYATLGNHDDPDQRNYKGFNMKGERYYTFKPRRGVRFFSLDSNYLDKPQLEWFEKELANSGSDWKIAFFHHPPYSSGETHGSSISIRSVLEPLFVKYNVSVVLCGHEHFYERIKPQKGVQYFISGAGGQLRKGNINRDELLDKGFDQDRHFMLMEIDGDDLYFQAISRTGTTVDSGVLHRTPVKGASVAE